MECAQQHRTSMHQQCEQTHYTKFMRHLVYIRVVGYETLFYPQLHDQSTFVFPRG